MSELPSPLGATLAGKFLVKRLLGQGGMGSVYEGTHVEIGKRVAIKIIAAHHAKSGTDLAARFRQEARAASRVESDHIVQVFDVGQDDVFGLYMVMEFLTGEDVATRLDREERLSPELAVDITHQAARGLSKAHAAGVIHRDLKPANVFLSVRDDGHVTVKLVDFGISKVLTEGDENPDPKRPITRWGSAVGTPQYMSPQQAQGQPIDARTDVWSLGACLYEMLSGRQAYEQLETYEQTIFAIVLKKPPPLSEIAPWVPASVIAIVDQALEHDVELRIPDCATFARMLHDALPEAFATSPHSREARDARDGARVIHGEVDGTGPDAIVIPAGEGGSRNAHRGAVAATQPLLAASGSNPRIRISPPTESGVSVQAPALGLRHEDEPTPSSPRARGSRGFIAVAIVLMMAGAGLYAVTYRGGSSGSAPTNGGDPSRAVTGASPSVSSSQLAADTNATGVAGASSSGSASTKKPLGSAMSGKFLGKLPPVASSAKASSSVVPGVTSAAPSTTSTEPQFGGTGVSSAY